LPRVCRGKGGVEQISVRSLAGLARLSNGVEHYFLLHSLYSTMARRPVVFTMCLLRLFLSAGSEMASGSTP